MDINGVCVGVHKLHPEAFDPVYATEGSACFDLRACFPAGQRLVRAVSGKTGYENNLMAVSQTTEDTVHILIPPKERVLIPTQLIFDIPEGWSMRLHMRSGLAFKGGLTLSNGEGVIDWDYTDQVFVAVTNTNETTPIRVNHGDRICQGEMVPIIRGLFSPTIKPQKKTNRTGGFGSTGKG